MVKAKEKKTQATKYLNFPIVFVMLCKFVNLQELIVNFHYDVQFFLYIGVGDVKNKGS